VQCYICTVLAFSLRDGQTPQHVDVTGARKWSPNRVRAIANELLLLLLLLVKVKNRPRRHREGEEVQLYSFFNLGTRCGGWSTPRSGRFTSGKTWYPLYRRVGGPQGRSGRVRKTSPPPGFDPRTVQLVASCYTD
jgi:hypothetical protein